MIEKVFFVASPVGIKPIRYYDGDLRFVENFNLNWNSIRETCKNFTVFHSDNDPYVCLENGKELSKQLEAKFIFISNSGHFNKDAGYIKFDRLLEEINL